MGTLYPPHTDTMENTHQPACYGNPDLAPLGDTATHRNAYPSTHRHAGAHKHPTSGNTYPGTDLAARAQPLSVNKARTQV